MTVTTTASSRDDAGTALSLPSELCSFYICYATWLDDAWAHAGVLLAILSTYSCL
jgi:hypothetical protein